MTGSDRLIPGKSSWASDCMTGTKSPTSDELARIHMREKTWTRCTWIAAFTCISWWGCDGRKCSVVGNVHNGQKQQRQQHTEEEELHVEWLGGEGR